MADEAKELQVAVPGCNNAARADGLAGANETDKLSYEIFSILESKFLFGYDEHKLFVQPSPPSPPHDASVACKSGRGKVCVLCIDGAGAGPRAAAVGKALAYLENSLRSCSGDPGARVADFFDLVAGAGAGGAFAAMLFATRGTDSRPLYAADDTWRLVAHNAASLFRTPRAARLFGKKRPLSAASTALDAAMKATFGEDLTLKDTLKPVLISCYDLKTSAPFVFSRADALETDEFDFRLWEVCRAAWTEPGRHEPIQVRPVGKSSNETSVVAVDAGIDAMSNPAIVAVTHVLHNKEEFPFVRGVEDLLVLSIGCGNAVVADGGDVQRLRKWGQKEWARPVGKIAADGAAELVDHAVARAFGAYRSSNYVRVQVNETSMVGNAAYSECPSSPSGMRAVINAADEMLRQRNVESVLFEGKRIGDHTNAEKLELFAAKLVTEHRSRGSRIAPTVAFKQPPIKPNT